MGDDTSVKVAVRIRPQISREIIEMCHVCTFVSPGEPQVWLGKDKTFTFDHVFDSSSLQEEVYDRCISSLIEGCFEGYNATVFAYGQTGSGKTYTMGTGFDINLLAHESGVIPRAVQHLFNGIAERQRTARENGYTPPEFKINAQFMELYNEEIIDLLNPGDLDEKEFLLVSHCLPSFQGKRGHIKIHEDSRGGIYTVGVTTRAVTSIDETLQCLKVGALSRTTGSTQMNSQSSRSHAIFTLHVKQQRIIKVMENLDEQENEENEGNEFETLTAKFHFVDLAGSERLKRTGATGERAKEGISINCGLLALGNVISALGDKARKISHVPYRDSKLTRLLQDSLGGNSHTLMIACVSPSDRDFMETLNTLKYANRAKNIKNKVMVNQDKSSQTISALRRDIQRLELELMEYKQGKRLINEDGSEQINDMFHENTMLQNENTNLRTRIKALQETIERLTVRNSELLAEKQTGAWITSGDGSKSDITEMIQGYIKEIEELRAKLVESEEVCTLLRRQSQRAQNRLSRSPTSATIAFSGEYDISTEAESHSSYELMLEAKKDIRKLKKIAKTLKKEKEGEDEEDEEKEKQEDGERKQHMDEEGNEVANGIDDDDEDEESSESETEDKVQVPEELITEEEYSEHLAQLTSDISLKEKLIQELELSQRRLMTMRLHYEEKLAQLQHRIKQTEQERDRVLANLGPTENQSDEKVKRVKDQFEKKLANLQSELRKMQAAKKEHAQLMRTQSQHERHIEKLKSEVLDMKRIKVRLLTKIKEESARHQEEAKRTRKEIEQLRKDSRRKENQIRHLEADMKIKENVLRRTREEVSALKRHNKPMSDKVAGRVVRRVTGNSYKVSAKQAKIKWHNLEKNINKLVLNKQCVYNVERDMDRWLHDREKLVRCLERLLKKRDRAILDGKDESAIRDLEDQIENLKANIEYLHENINECQQNISQLEEAKDDFDALDMNNVMGTIHLDESKYLIEKLLSMAIHQSFVVAQKDLSIKEMEVKLQQVVENNSVQQQLLQHLLHQADEDMYNFAMAAADNDEVGSTASSRSASPVDTSQVDMLPAGNAGTLTRRDKARRKTATTEELLYVRETADLISPQMEIVSEMSDNKRYSPVRDSTLLTPSDDSQDGMHRVTSAPGSLREMGGGKLRPDHSPSVYRKSYNILPDVSPAMRRKNYNNLNRAPSPPSRQNSVDTTTSDITPPSSPPMGRRNREDNVFSRLTSSIKISNKPDRGIIAPFSSKNQSKNSLLVCSHIAEGHSKAVLSITATDDVLFSSSKDRTVKIWDLPTGREIQSLSGHPNNVVAIRYCEYSRLAFSVSASYVKVWDVRENPAKCIKTLSSSGLAINGAVVQTTPSRTSHMPPGEQQINDVALNQYGTTLYSAAGNTVRIWDLKMFHCIGKLSGGHQAAVMCLAVDDLGMDTNLVVTGSKDHYIKVFEVVEGVTGMHSPKLNLSPPHYDGIQSLAISGDFLFSGSRDMCIKKWDLSNNSLVQSLNQAHKDWICSLSFLPTGNHLLSGCRGGYLKLWSVDACQLLGEIRAHNAPINSITTNSSAVFTASNEPDIKIWKPQSSNSSLANFELEL